MEQRYDVVGVGGGHNGLTAAFYFARAGLKTLVLERREVVGRCQGGRATRRRWVGCTCGAPVCIRAAV